MAQEERGRFLQTTNHHRDFSEEFALHDLVLLDVKGKVVKSSSRKGKRAFKTLGSGSFGSIYLGVLEMMPGIDYKRFHTGIWREKYAPQDLYKFNSHWWNRTSPNPAASLHRNSSWDRLTACQDVKVYSKKVAVKKLTHEDQIDDMMREAESLRVLWASRNVVNVYGMIYSKVLESSIIVMDIVSGPSLNTYLKSRGSTLDSNHPSDVCANADSEEESGRRLSGPLWWKKKLEIIRELVLGLILCHKQGVYHGDLKCENVLLDKFHVPKLIDFGMSFRRRSHSYFKDAGGSVFWVSPEIYDADDKILPAEVLENPYPSDVYSLGMILVEMSLDGELPTDVSDCFVMDKLQGGSPIPVRKADFGCESFFQRLEDLVDKCCRAERDERISLEECLSKVDDLYSEVCKFCSFHDPFFQEDAAFVASDGYKEKVNELRRTRIPNVPECILLQPSKNMMLDPNGNLLVHYFCALDFGEGVEYITKRGTWEFEPEKEIPYMSLLSVREGSLSVLKYLAKEWREIMVQEQILVHEACNLDDPDILRFLLVGVGMDYDTWDKDEQLKPMHKLAMAGKNEMIKVIVDCSRSDSLYIDTVIKDSLTWRQDTPLYYAVQGDHMDTVWFLLREGAGLNLGTFNERYGHDNESIASDSLLDRLLEIAFDCGSLRVATGLLEYGSSHYARLPPSKFPTLFEQISRRQDCGAVVELLKEYLRTVDAIGIGCNALRLACEKGKETVLTALLGLGMISGNSSLKARSREHVCEHGSTEMLQLLLDTDNKTNQDYDLLLDIAWKHNNTEIHDFLMQRTDLEIAAAKDCPVQSASIHCPQEAVENVVAIMLTKDMQDSAVIEELNRLAIVCCESGKLESLKNIVEVREVMLKETATAARLLHKAAFNGHVEVVKYLVKKGVPVDVYEESVTRRAPLHWAIAKGREQVAKVLLEEGANPNLRDCGGYTCMDVAMGLGARNVVSLLIKHGFDLGMRDPEDNQTYMSHLPLYDS